MAEITGVQAFKRAMVFKFDDGTEKSVPFTMPSAGGGSEPTVRDIVGQGPIQVEDRHGIFFINSQGTGGEFDFIVDSDGTTDFKTIQSAIDAAEARAANPPASILVLAGTYSENLTIVESDISIHGFTEASGATVVNGNISVTNNSTSQFSFAEFKYVGELTLAGSGDQTFIPLNLEGNNSGGNPACRLSNTNSSSTMVPLNFRIVTTDDLAPALIRDAGSSYNIDGTDGEFSRNGSSNSALPAIDFDGSGSGIFLMRNGSILGQVNLDNCGCSFTYRDGEHTVAGTATPYTINSFTSAVFVLGGTLTSIGGANAFSPSPNLSQFFFANVILGTSNTVLDTTIATRFTVDGMAWFSDQVNGFIGIGVQPDTPLHVQTASATATPVANTIITAENSGDAFISVLGGSSNKRGIIFGDAVDNSDTSIIIDGSDNTLEFRHEGAVRRMTITSAGNVGIGDFSALAPLHVQTGDAGAVNPTGGTVIAAEANGNCFISCLAPITASSAIIFGSPVNGNASSIRHNTGAVPDGLLFRTNNNTNKMALTAGGSLGIGVDSPDASAILQTDSTTQGFLPPRMTLAERNAISSPAAGLIIFNLSDAHLNFFNGSIWREVAEL